VNNFDEQKSYKVISAKSTEIIPDSDILTKGIDMGLMRLHINNAPERRKWLGLREDRDYEIMVIFSPVHLHGTEQREVMKVKYSKFFNIEKENIASGFTYKKMFQNLMIKGSLSIDVNLTEIDNDKVDPEPLRTLLNDTGIGTALDLSPYNPKEYLILA